MHLHCSQKQSMTHWGTTPNSFPGAIQKQLQSLHPISQMGNQNITSKLYSLLYNVTYIR